MNNNKNSVNLKAKYEVQEEQTLPSVIWFSSLQIQVDNLFDVLMLKSYCANGILFS